MSIVFIFGLIGVVKSHFPSVLIFACMDTFLLVITFFGSYSTHGANMATFVVFLVTTALSYVFASLLWDNYIKSKRFATIRYLYNDCGEDNDNCYYNDCNHRTFQQLQSQWTVECIDDSKQLIGARYAV